MWRSSLFIVLISFSAFSQSAAMSMTVSVIRTLIDDTNYGGCMALVSPTPSSQGLNCGSSGWVTFSCSGDFNSREVGNQKLAAAQLALLANTRVSLVVFDNKKHNGYCYASRIDNLAN